MTLVQDPIIIEKFFSNKKYNYVMNYVNSIERNRWFFEDMHSRYIITDSEYLNKLSLLELNRARKVFNSDTLIYTYSLLALYNNDNSRLIRHKDDNACTYTFDICLYAEKPWPLIVEDKEYIIEKNQALSFYGEDQWHERPPFDKDNKVLMLFMHWAEPDHSFFEEVGGVY